MKKTRRINSGAPLSLWASRVFFAALLALAAGPLFADGPAAPAANWLGQAQTALKTGGGDAIGFAAKALKAAPSGAAENRQMAYSMFWAGRFDDAARYLRRALAADRDALMSQGPLADLMPADDATQRLNEVAPKAEKDTELCFLTGAMLLVNHDRVRALSFLIRAEELAGTDAQAADLADVGAKNRNLSRGETALRKGDWNDAVRAFAYAALDAPTVARHYAGLVIGLAGAGDDDMALKLASNVYARYRANSLLPWLRALGADAETLRKAAERIEGLKDAGLAHHKLAALLQFTAGHYTACRDASVKALLADKLDDFIHDLESYMEQNHLQGNPSSTPQPEQPPEPPSQKPPVPRSEPSPEQPSETPGKPESAPPAPEKPPAPPQPAENLDTARKALRKGDYTAALKVLDKLTNEKAEPEVYRLLFVVLVGRGELTEAETSFQNWVRRANDTERMRKNALRELFSSKELFDEWRRNIDKVRTATPNAGLPRLLSCYVNITLGRYNDARDDLVVAKIESPQDEAVHILERLLQKPEYQHDATPDGVPDDPTPKALMGLGDRAFHKGDYESAKTDYLKAIETDPKLPYVTLSLLRCYFALGDYDNAARQLRVMLDAQQMDSKEAREFKLLVEPGYEDKDAFDKHLAALKKECDTRPLSSTPWMLYGMIQLGRKQYKDAADALKVWYDNDTSKKRDPLLLKFYEYAKQRAS